MSEPIPHDPGGATHPLAHLLDDPRLTAMGLCHETHSGLIAAVEPSLADHGFTSSSFEVLIRLARSDGHRLQMTALARQSTLSNSGLTRVVDRLEDGGLVRRVQDREDKRVWFTELTPAGLDALLSALPAHIEVVDEILTGVLDDDEMAAFERALRKIRAVVKPGADPELSPA
ncbi:MAG: MarR family transcriptional regulator [Acidimicrobiales bacterium]